MAISKNRRLAMATPSVKTEPAEPEPLSGPAKMSSNAMQKEADHVIPKVKRSVKKAQIDKEGKAAVARLKIKVQERASAPKGDLDYEPTSNEEDRAGKLARRPRDAKIRQKKRVKFNLHNNGRVPGRKLVPWHKARTIEKLLLHLVYESYKAGITLPWDAAVARLAGPGRNGTCASQHIHKLRTVLLAEGHMVPPMMGKRTSKMDPKIRGFVRDFSATKITASKPLMWGDEWVDLQESLPIPGLIPGSGNYRKDPVKLALALAKKQETDEKKKVMLAQETDVKPKARRAAKRRTEGLQHQSNKKDMSGRSTPSGNDMRMAPESRWGEDLESFFDEADEFPYDEAGDFGFGDADDEDDIESQGSADDDSSDSEDYDPVTNANESSNEPDALRVLTLRLPQEFLRTLPLGESYPRNHIAARMNQATGRYLNANGRPGYIEDRQLHSDYGFNDRRRLPRAPPNTPVFSNNERDHLRQMSFEPLSLDYEDPSTGIPLVGSPGGSVEDGSFTLAATAPTGGPSGLVENDSSSPVAADTAPNGGGHGGFVEDYSFSWATPQMAPNSGGPGGLVQDYSFGWAAPNTAPTGSGPVDHIAVPSLQVSVGLNIWAPAFNSLLVSFGMTPLRMSSLGHTHSSRRTGIPLSRAPIHTFSKLLEKSRAYHIIMFNAHLEGAMSSMLIHPIPNTEGIVEENGLTGSAHSANDSNTGGQEGFGMADRQGVTEYPERASTSLPHPFAF